MPGQSAISMPWSQVRLRRSPAGTGAKATANAARTSLAVRR
jgi:hypothetical protein